MNSYEQEIRYRLLKILESDPSLTQRQMAEKMGISLGKLNYCLAEFARKGLVKINRFKSSDNKAAYMYVLTPSGISEKSKVTISFLNRKMKEYEEIKKQIEELSNEITRGESLP